MGEHREKLSASISSPTQRPDIPRTKRPDYEGVRGRADQAHMDLEMKKGWETGFLPKGLSRQYTGNVENTYRSGRSIIRPGIYEQIRAGKSISEVRKSNNQLRENSRLAFFGSLSEKESMRDPHVQKQIEHFIALLRKLPKTRNRNEQEKLVNEIARTTETKYDHATVREMSIIAARTESDAEFAEKALANKAFAQTFEAEALKTDDADAAFAEALKASPELLVEYKRQEDFWKSEQVADVFGPPQIPGKTVEEARPAEWRQVFDQVSGQGITLHVGETGGTGELHFGDMVRQCAVYRVDGAPQFFIFDRNADRGIIGPFEPASIRTELAHLQIDEFFSQKFREFSTTESEKDPTKVGDQKLIKIVRAFLPNRAENSSEHLGADERRLLTNLARLFVAPDPAYPSLSSKIEFFERIFSQPKQVALAADFLVNNDFQKNRMTLTEFGNEI